MAAVGVMVIVLHCIGTTQFGSNGNGGNCLATSELLVNNSSGANTGNGNRSGGNSLKGKLN